MPLYLGTTGNLTALPPPLRGVQATAEPMLGEHRTLGGGRAIDYTGQPRRTYSLAWRALTDAQYAILEAFHTQGRGPFLMLPQDVPWNYFTPNAASGSDVLAGVAGFSVAGAGESLASVMPSGYQPVHGLRVVEWSLPASPAGGVLAAETLPGAAGLPLAVSASVRSTRAVELRLAGTWLTATGGTGTFAGAAATVAAAWTRLSFTGTFPAGAAWAAVMIKATPSTVTAATVVAVDALRADLSATAGPWRPGRGVPRVSITSLTDTYPWADLHDAEMTLAEVG
ncbi:hypothetical protein [Longispora albida]|uniref:hypothetical protein n=1 Tax=Longispora albida TaxID=203523 RepID=UPI000373AD98|nr:hypothetical protein [Longispora albida]